jgi:BirA family biotin operon repressor/biotin-[acetyl-CoA-carboxylase] ligase
MTRGTDRAGIRRLPGAIGRPRHHFRTTTSTNLEAARLAAAGAPHGTLVTASEQSAGRGRQGRRWLAPAGQALLLSLVLRAGSSLVGGLLPLRAGLAVVDIAGPRAALKWPNDVLLDGRKVAGILVEAFPQRGWAVLGIGVNVAVDPATLPGEVAVRAGTLGRAPEAVEGVLGEVLERLELRLAEPEAVTRAAWQSRDVLAGRAVEWADGSGVADGIDERGALRVMTREGVTVALDGGEVHLRGVTGL